MTDPRLCPRLGFALALLQTAAAVAQGPRLVGAPGLPVMVNDPAAAALVVGGTRDAKTYEVHASTIADAPRPGSQTPDPRWYWLTGSPFPPRWVELDAGVPAKDPRRAGAFDIRWTEPLSLAEFNAARAVDGKGKPLPVGDDRASRLWLDSAERGWVALSRAALVIIDAVPADQRAGLFDFLETATRTPGDHWRAALLRRAIRPATPAKPDFEPAALNTLALQLGEQWAAAIGRLEAADGVLAARTARRLLTVAYIPTGETTGRWAVLWADADPELLQTLLTAGKDQLATAATSALAAQPGSITWVHDDAGLRDPVSGGPGATVGALSFDDRPAVVSAARSTGREIRPEPRTLKPLFGMLMPAPGPAGDSAGVVTMRIGAGASTLSGVFTPVRAGPPGVLIGPFSFDWTRAAFTAQRPAGAPGVAGSLVPAEAGAWTLYLERRAVRDSDIEGERFTVWAGPTGAASLEISVAPDGSTDRRRGDARVAVSRLPGGWCATVTLPPGVVDDRGLLRLAVSHTAGQGLRSAWPRPMLPWQAEPGRTAIDGTFWDRGLRP